MNEPFTLPLIFRKEELEFKARFERWGYTHRFTVLIGEATIAFEPDEEGGYRALTDPAHKADLIEPALMEEIAATLAKLQA